MRFSKPTLAKFVREALVTATPMALDEAGVAALKARLTAWFAGVEVFAMHWQARPKEKGTHALCRFTTSDRYGYAWGGFELCRDGEGRLDLTLGYRGDSVPVGDLDELFEFLRLCRDRIARQKGQEAKSNKVRRLREAAVAARVGELARRHRFDYATRARGRSLEIFLRFGRRQIVELKLPLARFDETLPRLEATLPALLELATAGVSASAYDGRNRNVRYLEWVTYGPAEEAAS